MAKAKRARKDSGASRLWILTLVRGRAYYHLIRDSFEPKGPSMLAARKESFLSVTLLSFSTIKPNIQSGAT